MTAFFDKIQAGFIHSPVLVYVANIGKQKGAKYDMC